jgi:hypothetical protein
MIALLLPFCYFLKSSPVRTHPSSNIRRSKQFTVSIWRRPKEDVEYVSAMHKKNSGIQEDEESISTPSPAKDEVALSGLSLITQC